VRDNARRVVRGVVCGELRVDNVDEVQKVVERRHLRGGRGRVGAWARGRVGAWARGRVGAWARGRVGVARGRGGGALARAGGALTRLVPDCSAALDAAWDGVARRRTSTAATVAPSRNAMVRVRPGCWTMRLSPPLVGGRADRGSSSASNRGSASNVKPDSGEAPVITTLPCASDSQARVGATCSSALGTRRQRQRQRQSGSGSRTGRCPSPTARCG
jgi:hypothetical protein